MRGIIASDIDRTLTNKEHVIPDDVIAHLKKCHKMGFEIVFLTGRPLSFCGKALARVDFPFHLGVQNGAEVLKMPEGESKRKSFIPHEDVVKICEMHEFSDRDFIVYSGIAGGDHSCYNPGRFKGAAQEYIENFAKLGVVNWKEVDCVKTAASGGTPLMRLFGTLEEMEKLQKRVLAEMDVNAVILNDVVQDGTHLLMITAKDVNKGQSLRKLIDHYDWKGHVIGCGDDLNDVPLFEEVDISIGMKNGHPHLLQKATIIAEPAHEMGIIEALDRAIEMTNG